jgi:hypothetical protein
MQYIVFKIRGETTKCFYVVYVQYSMIFRLISIIIL